MKYTNIENWSRNDILEYGKLIGVNFTFNGYGYAKDTDITDNIINKGETKEIKLEPKYTKPT